MLHPARPSVAASLLFLVCFAFLVTGAAAAEGQPGVLALISGPAEAAHPPPALDGHNGLGPIMQPAQESPAAPLDATSASTAPKKSGIDPELEEMIHCISDEHGVDAHLVKGLIKVESGFDPNAKSRRGACGLMQLMPRTAKKMGAKDIFDPGENLRAGVKYLSYLLDLFGNVPSALAAYLRGPAAVFKHGGVPKDRMTRSFVSRILRYSTAFGKSAESGGVVAGDAASQPLIAQ